MCVAPIATPTCTICRNANSLYLVSLHIQQKVAPKPNPLGANRMYSTCQKPLGKPKKPKQPKTSVHKPSKTIGKTKKNKKNKTAGPMSLKADMGPACFCVFWFSQWSLIVYALTSFVVLFFCFPNGF